jgi:hypothetical protein
MCGANATVAALGGRLAHEPPGFCTNCDRDADATGARQVFGAASVYSAASPMRALMRDLSEPTRLRLTGTA